MQAIYPTMVVVLVNRRYMFDEAHFMNPSLPPITPGLDTDDAETLERISFSTPSFATSTSTSPGQNKKTLLSTDIGVAR